MIGPSNAMWPLPVVSRAFVMGMTVLLMGCGSREVASPRNPTVNWSKLAVQYQADLGWIKRVREIAARQPILTADLQREWIVDRPIAFPGVLVDAVAISGDRYLLDIRAAGEFTASLEVFDQAVALQIECPATEVIPLLRPGSNVTKPYTIDPTILLIAKVSRVTGRQFVGRQRVTESYPEESSDASRVTMDWKIGFGECVHIEPLRAQAR